MLKTNTMAKTKSKTSPQNSKRGCICKDGTYNVDCCDGSIQAQGIGGLNEQGVSNVVNTNEPRVISNSRG